MFAFVSKLAKLTLSPFEKEKRCPFWCVITVISSSSSSFPTPFFFLLNEVIFLAGFFFEIFDLLIFRVPKDSGALEFSRNIFFSNFRTFLKL